jgi:hypothetical protein
MLKAWSGGNINYTAAYDFNFFLTKILYIFLFLFCSFYFYIILAHNYFLDFCLEGGLDTDFSAAAVAMRVCLVV